MAEARKPWAFIAHHKGKLAGIVAADYVGCKKSLRSYRHYDIVTVHSREEYERALETLDAIHKANRNAELRHEAAELRQRADAIERELSND